MVNLVRTGLYIGAAYVLAQGLTEDKILSDKNVRNVVLGGLAGHLFGDKLEELVKNNLSDEQKKQLYSGLAGAGIGALGGLLVYNGNLSSVKNKIQNYFGSKGSASGSGTE